MVADDDRPQRRRRRQVAHALSVHAVDNEYDYFTAVDDHKNADDDEDAGAGMIGTVEFNSSTLYRYATVDVDRLRDNLGDAEATRRAVEAFVRAFVQSMPTGKQNTFANRTLPDAVLVVLRDTQSINLVGAFEDAITGRDHGRVASRDRSVGHARRGGSRGLRRNPGRGVDVRARGAAGTAGGHRRARRSRHHGRGVGCRSEAPG